MNWGVNPNTRQFQPELAIVAKITSPAVFAILDSKCVGVTGLTFRGDVIGHVTI